MTTVVPEIAIPGAATDSPRAMASRRSQPTPLYLHNLLNDLASLAPMLLDQLRHGSSLNAFLLAAGMNQIVEDYLHPDPFLLGKTAKYLTQLGKPAHLLAARIIRLIGAAIWRVREYHPQTRRLSRWQADWAVFVQRLADLVVDSPRSDSISRSELIDSGEAMIARTNRFPPHLLDAVLRLPACFRGFDQQPGDLERLVQDFSKRWSDRDRSLAVIGIRTSGNYLAPLIAALLKRRGYRDVRVLTLRPERRFFDSERAQLQAIIRENGLVLVTDDPPGTGAAMAKALKELERLGVPDDAIVLLLQLFGPRDSLPRVLQQYASVLVPWDEWHIHERLTPLAVQATLTKLIGKGTKVSGVKRLPLPPRKSVRSHVYALYRVHLTNQNTSHEWDQPVFVKGVGLGYLGEYSLAVAGKLRGFLPHVYGLQDGLLYRAWLPEERRLSTITPGQEKAIAKSLANYVVTRQRALAVDKDVSERLFGAAPVWEVASDLQSRVYGSAWPFLRVPVVDPIMKRLLRTAHPSVVDGRMLLSNWFADGTAGNLLKADFDEGTFSTTVELTCYDAAFELASLVSHYDLFNSVPSTQVKELTQHLRDAYTELAHESVDEERWLLYELVHLWDMQHTDHTLTDPVRRASARSLQRYFSATFLKDLPFAAGELCAIDIDGVLETTLLGFPALTPAGALTLRALIAHDYRPILVTGRSVEEVRERCDAYHLAGGVAEYGAVVCNSQSGKSAELLSARDRADLEKLRAVLSKMNGVCLDSDHRYAVRACRIEQTGQKRNLDPEIVAAALRESGTQERIRPIAGQAQTDFMVVGIDKGTGLRVLANDLGVGADSGNGKPFALAVGDAFPDLPMFQLAKLASAPANADAHVRHAGVKIMSQPYQRGLAQAVGQLLGHQPGHCSLCRVPPLSAETQMLLNLLAAPEVGKWTRVRDALRLGVRVKWSRK